MTRRAAALVFCVVMAGGAAAALPDEGVVHVPGMSVRTVANVVVPVVQEDKPDPSPTPSVPASPTPRLSPRPRLSPSPTPSLSPSPALQRVVPKVPPAAAAVVTPAADLAPAATPSPTPVVPSPTPAVSPAGSALGGAVVVSTSSSVGSVTPKPALSSSPTPKPVAKSGSGAVGAGAGTDTFTTTLASSFAAELVPVASTPAGQQAVAWAEDELHSADPAWSDEIGAPWSGYCEAFVEIAYGTRYKYASAKTDYLAQKAAGRIHTDDNPPAGALVFYGGGPDGHVALSIDGARVISTWGFRGDRYPVRKVAVRGFTNPYYGWALPPAGWPGRK